MSCQRAIALDPQGAETAGPASITIVTSIAQTPFFMRFPGFASPDLRNANAADLRNQFQAAVDKLGARISRLEGHPLYNHAFPSTFTNSQRGSATGTEPGKHRGSHTLCGEGWVMVGTTDDGEVSCAQLYLAP